MSVVPWQWLVGRDDLAYKSHYLAGQTKTKNRCVQQSAVMGLTNVRVA
jgi:hypothetical protein